VHLDSSGAGTTDGQKVSTWVDSSGNGHPAVTTVQPSNATFRLYPDVAAPLVSFAPTYNPLKIAAIVDDFNEFTVAFSLRPRTLQNYNQRLGTSQLSSNSPSIRIKMALRIAPNYASSTRLKTTALIPSHRSCRMMTSMAMVPPTFSS
jgi:hypothetical protein